MASGPVPQRSASRSTLPLPWMMSVWAGSFVAGCLVMVAIPLLGCSGGQAVSAPASTAVEPAKAAVASFLDAVKRGDDAAARGMLTKVAAAKTKEMGISVAPPVPASATYSIRECEIVGDSEDLMHVATTETRVRSFVPSKWAASIEALLAGSNQRRHLVAVDEGAAPLPPGESRIRSYFEPSRRRGVLHVRAGRADLVDALMQKVAWMAAGHMEHISVLVPVDTPEVAAAIPLLEECGLFYGGYIPDLDGRDCILLQWLDIAAIDVVGEEALALRDEVSREWRRSRAAGLCRPSTSALAG